MTTTTTTTTTPATTTNTTNTTDTTNTTASPGMPCKHCFTYHIAITPTLNSTTASDTLTGGQGTIGIIGAKFGNDSAQLKVYLNPIGATTVRRRNLYTNHISQTRLPLHRPLAKQPMSNFFLKTLQNQKTREIRWKVGGSGSRQTTIPSFSKDDLPKRAMHTGAFILFEDDYPMHHHASGG